MKISTSTYIQAGVWVSLFAIPMLIFGSVEMPEGFYAFLGARVFLLAVFFNLSFHLVAPLYFLGRKRVFYRFSILAFLGYVSASVALDFTIEPGRKMAFMAPNADFVQAHRLEFAIVPATLSGLLIFGISAALAGFSAFEKKKREEETANRRRLEAELSLLKSQINPHFLLNSLNNLYALALTMPEKMPDALLKLSEMVAYILHECDQPSIALVRDLHFIENYIALQRLRLPPNAVLTVEMPEKPPKGNIEPMVLISFIENAFKHGLTTKQPCEILVAIKVERNQLHLRVENPVLPPKLAHPNGNQSGIGLANTQQRLAHTYPEKHVLKIENDGQKHLVDLTIELDFSNAQSREPK